MPPPCNAQGKVETGGEGRGRKQDEENEQHRSVNDARQTPTPLPRHRVRRTPIPSRPPSSATLQGATAPPRPTSPNRACNTSTPTCAPLPALRTSVATSPPPRKSKCPAPCHVTHLPTSTPATSLSVTRAAPRPHDCHR
ncbi:hypothetical protein CPC08DRAFT_770956 [Agrocybe pediades]|nr:hypothetical protein CPC08DRAFT_770956 [Agrocybe pediades]